jgi:hypothetical protein
MENICRESSKITNSLVQIVDLDSELQYSLHKKRFKDFDVTKNRTLIYLELKSNSTQDAQQYIELPKLPSLLLYCGFCPSTHVLHRRCLVLSEIVTMLRKTIGNCSNSQ